MKRDMDLCRKILLELESIPANDLTSLDRNLAAYSKQEVSYNIMLLAEAGLVIARDFSTNDIHWEAQRLTWEGHEFLDAARDNIRWEKAKVAMTHAGGFALDVMKQLLIQYLRQDLKLT